MNSRRDSPTRVYGWRSRSFDLLPGETIVKRGRAGGYETKTVAGTGGCLYLTTQRVVLAPDWLAIFRPPTLAIRHEQVECVYMTSEKAFGLWATSHRICLQTRVPFDYGYRRTKRPCFRFWTARQAKKWLDAIVETTNAPLRDQNAAA